MSIFDVCSQSKSAYGIDFQIGEDCLDQVVLPGELKGVVGLLREKLTSNPFIVDAFACYGWNSVAMIDAFPSCSLIAVQNVRDAKCDTMLKDNLSASYEVKKVKCGALITVSRAITEIWELDIIKTKPVDLLVLDIPSDLLGGETYDDASILEFVSAMLPPRSASVTLKNVLLRLDGIGKISFEGFERKEHGKYVLFSV